MNILRDQNLREKLSAEYVLGTLKGGARRRFENLLKESALLEQSVAAWQDRLYPLSEFTSSITPPPSVWDKIQTNLNLHQQEQKKTALSFWRNLGQNLHFWRTIGLVSSAFATILAIVLVTKPPTEVLSKSSYVAMLSDEKAQLGVVVTVNLQTQKLVANVVTHQVISTDKSLELWAIPKDGPPHALGLVAANGTVTLPLSDHITPEKFTLLAISLEPKGGSPDPHSPTGPILFKGGWAQI